MIIKTPTTHTFVAGSSEGYTPLNAFDGALLAAGVGNTNLVKMSSIVPPGTREIPVSALSLPPGALVPIAYAAMESDIPGSMICAAVAAAWPVDPAKPGLIMEYHAHGHREDAEAVVRRMAEEGMKKRGWEIRDLRSLAIDHRVEKIGAAFAAVVLWDLP
ncbi:MAG TPA: arginine decarboxylase, pyruvoyl-dependent [Acidiferrobacteraceae bacterium]|nr:arginine decarboxylase, pyruvoyl-dependent [Acidiferrobacteraceae bacterium]